MASEIINITPRSGCYLIRQICPMCNGDCTVVVVLDQEPDDVRFEEHICTCCSGKGEIMQYSDEV